jgi:hypothetical protein
MLVWLVCLLARDAKDFLNFCGGGSDMKGEGWGRKLSSFSEGKEHCAAFLGRFLIALRFIEVMRAFPAMFGRVLCALLICFNFI